MLYRAYLEKIATLRKQAAEQFDVDKEKDLIRQYQMTKNPQILRRLVKVFDGAIQSAIQASPVYNMNDPVAIRGKALGLFKKAIESYNPDNTKGAKPTTHIYNTIYRGLQKENYRNQNDARMSEVDEILNIHIHNAEQRLALEGITNPTAQQIQQEIHRMRPDKFYSLDQINEVRNLQRTSLYGGKIMGGDEGENIKTEDVYNTGDLNASDIYDTTVKRESLMNSLNKLSPLEKNIIMDRHGLGGRPKETKWSRLALNNNIKNTYRAKKIYQDALEKLRRLQQDDE